MDTDTFWDIIETARKNTPVGASCADALVDQLASRSRQDILEYQERFDDAHGAIHRWDVWAAAYLINGGCSDDSFTDFCAGLIVLGRDWYEKAAAAPDSLADHPTVLSSVSHYRDGALFDEVVNYAAPYAFKRITGDEEDFYEAWDAYEAEHQSQEGGSVDMGEDFDFGDHQEMRRRLPRLAALYLHDSMG